jgi:fructose-1,6-bisphosphatase/inositol monophosphatase family enzyme
MAIGEKEFAIGLAKKAGLEIRRAFGFGNEKRMKKDNTPVTNTDLAINRIMVDAVKERFPDHGILSEEGGDLSGRSGYVWVCDPLDGTVPFLHGIPTCVFSLALVKDGIPILGVVFEPFTDRMFHAEKGRGAFLNGKRIGVSKDKEFMGSAIGLCNWIGSKFDLNVMYGKLIDRGVHVLDLGGITYMGALVANGEFLASVFPGENPWDSAALKVIVEEAGGKVTDLFGKEQRYDTDINGCIFSNGKLHKQLVELGSKSRIR